MGDLRSELIDSYFRFPLAWCLILLVKRLMRYITVVAVLASSISIAQSLPAAEPRDVPVCELLNKASAFSGKLVRVQGTFKARFEYFALSDEGCAEAIWVDYADDVNVQPRPTFKLVRDEKFAEFERLIQTNHSVRAVVVGRFDGVDAVRRWTESRNSKDGAVVSFHSDGFGHMGEYRSRVVLKQVSEAKK
jgi:hypothetical protein